MSSEDKHYSQLWEQIGEGKEDAFKRLYNQNVNELYQYGLKLTSQNQLVEDCIQDLFIRIFRNHKKLGTPQNVRSYLLKSFRNNLIRLIVKEKRISYRDDEDYYFEIVSAVDTKIIESEENQKRKEILISALAKLPSRQKEAVYLKYTCALDYEEVAGIMGMGIESCRNTVYRAIKSLRNYLPRKQIVLFLLKKS